MEHEANNDFFLAQWLDGQLTDAQLKEMVSGDDFAAYLKLRESLSGYGIENPDLEKNYAAVKEKKIASLDKPKPRVLALYKYATIAALLVVFFGLYELFAFSEHAMAGFGQMRNVELADGSQVKLNAKSNIDFPYLFRYNRTLKLNGEAYFQVRKGSTFTVESPNGKVKVLGTKFNVVSRDGFFEAVCYEGKVKVSNNKFCAVLSPGEAIRFYGKLPETWKVSNAKPLWVSGESDFHNAPLQYVIGALENQYHQKIKYPEHLKQARFTGSFTNGNLSTALQSVCMPLNLKSDQSEPDKITISE